MTHNGVKLYTSTQPLQRINMTVLSDEERAELLISWDKYNEYVQQFGQNIFSFEDFVQHTTGKSYHASVPLESEYVETQNGAKNPI